MLPTGDERPGTTPADLVFIIEEKPHQKFSREGNDLVYNAKLPLVDALCGATVHLTTLDGRPLTVRFPLCYGCSLACRPISQGGSALLRPFEASLLRSHLPEATPSPCAQGISSATDWLCSVDAYLCAGVCPASPHCTDVHSDAVGVCQ